MYYVLLPSNARTHWELLRLQRHLLKPTDLAKYRLRTVSKNRIQVKLKADVSVPRNFGSMRSTNPGCHDQKYEKPSRI